MNHMYIFNEFHQLLMDSHHPERFFVPIPVVGDTVCFSPNPAIKFVVTSVEYEYSKNDFKINVNVCRKK